MFITLFPQEYDADGARVKNNTSRRGRKDDDDDIPF